MTETRERLTSNEWLFLGVIIIIGIFLRWLNLTDRPLHHDEALHALYGKYTYMYPETKFYRYNPLLHGPLMYNVYPWFYQVFGMAKWGVRAMAAFMGTILMLFPFLFRKYFRKDIFIALVALIAVSPTMIYWSRFIRHDCFVLFFMFLTLWGYCLKRTEFKAYFIFIGLALQFSVKENAYITTVLLAGYLLFQFLHEKLFSKNDCTSLELAISYSKKHWKAILFSVLIGAFVYSYFFSAGFRYMDGILDGLYRKSISYWVNQHGIERIKGPFIYHFLIFGWYELPFLVMFFLQIIHFYYKKSWKVRSTFILSFVIALVFHLIFLNENIGTHWFFGKLKLKIGIDFYPLIMIPVHAVITTFIHLSNNEKSKAFFGYFFLASLFTYSFVGEKVPWLALYPFTAGLIYIFLYFQNTTIISGILSSKCKYIILAVAFLFNLRIAIMTNFSRAGNATEFIGQVHGTRMYENIILKIKSEIDGPIKGKSPKILSRYDNLWPMAWYFYGESGYVFINTEKNFREFDYIFTKIDDLQLDKATSDTHRKLIIEMRHWWVPNYNKMTWGLFFDYAFSHNPWNRTGKKKIAFYSKK